MKVSLIVAMDAARGIGRDNDLMWHLPLDMQFFKDTTKGHIVVMGRRNYDSIPEKFRPLPGRQNVILTRNQSFAAPGCEVFNSLEDCLENYQNENDRIVFIIGGGEIYRLGLANPKLEEMYITHIDKTYGADTFFPEFEEDEWDVTNLFSQEIDARHEASFTVKKYTRKA